MTLAIVSDVHGNLEALEAVLAEIATQEVQAIACLGDFVGYGASPNECVALLRPLIALAVLIRGMDSLRQFDQIFALTHGGPGGAEPLRPGFPTCFDHLIPDLDSVRLIRDCIHLKDAQSTLAGAD